MRTTNILLFIIICNQVFSLIDVTLKNRMWYKVMKQIIPLVPKIKQVLGGMFGFDNEVEQDGKPTN